MKFLASVGAIALVMLCWFAVALMIAFPVKWLTNWVLTPGALALTFGGPLTVWKAWGLSWLCGLLFGFKSGKAK